MMAILWPRKLPDYIRRNERRRAEVRVYDKLGQVLDENYTVFYSSPWLGEDHLGNEKDGECDFMIAHPSMGFLAIEVKGGGISYDPATAQWKSFDGKFTFKIKDPVEQARSAKHELLKKLKAVPGWEHRWVHVSHGIIFPGATKNSRDLGADKPSYLFCYEQEFAHSLRGWVEARMRPGPSQTIARKLGKDGIAALERILAHPFTLDFRISAAMQDAKEELGSLEPQQFHVLQQIAEISRAEIKGGAGTGKTLLAMREARQCAESGLRTLLTCYSQPLANQLKRQVGTHEHLTTGSLLEVGAGVLRQAGLEVPLTSMQTERFMDAELPNLLLDAFSLRPELRWDCIVIDEGQDIPANWWIPIETANSTNGRLRIFTDINQRLYADRAIPAKDLQTVPIRLQRNLRNTKSIHAAASAHYEGPEIVAEGPEGLPVHWIEATSAKEMSGAAYTELRRLVYQQDVAPGNIAVLLPEESWVQNFLTTAAQSELEFSTCDDMETENVVVDTISRFRGLERPAVVVVAGTGQLVSPELAYVGLSRPRFYLAIVAHPSEIEWLKRGLNEQS